MRLTTNVVVRCYAFFEEVTIDEINYGDIADYHAYRDTFGYFETIDFSDSAVYRKEGKIY